ncbi:hypothetical protein RSOLAG1IB_04231 [Rhizoctonia solani AG-1 IB]|uniref:SWIM-type domain-containing protein n=1 Tax=Thanatephorus cucumeris (strain AG1-IB / isolate 7/3/14) TaxID=1108050 RepID=A0A0B7FXS3_THACB|nr:hypothetical protein RSOLAG1IB_04231 [Rhizoctonia solani AG-1 IB]
MSLATSQIAKAIILGIKDQELGEDTVVSLHRIFQDTFLEALDLIDREKVIHFVHQNREFIQVTGSDGVHHIFLDLMDLRANDEGEGNNAGAIKLNSRVAISWCSCETFLTRFLMSTEEQMCEHILAVLLGNQLGRLLTKTYNNHEICLNFLENS